MMDSLFLQASPVFTHTPSNIVGRYVSFDSTHTWETGMQTYVVGVQTLAVGVLPSTSPPSAQRTLYCDLAVR